MQRTIFEQNLEDYIPTGPEECKYFCELQYAANLNHIYSWKTYPIRRRTSHGGKKNW